MQQNAEQEINSNDFLLDEGLVAKVNENWKIKKINRPKRASPRKGRGNRSYRGPRRGYSRRRGRSSRKEFITPEKKKIE